MNRRALVFGGWVLILSIGLGSPAMAKKKKAASSPDAAYTGSTNAAESMELAAPSTNAATTTEPVATTNAATTTEPSQPKKKKKSAATDSTNAVKATTNEVEKPFAPISTTNAVTETEPAKPNAQKKAAEAEASPDTTLATTNSVAKPSAPAASTNTATAAGPPPAPESRVATLTTVDLKEYGSQPPRIQALITHALELTAMNLKYQYGSADPSKGGMDCSGTVYFLLRQAGLKDVPRDASELYSWVWKEGHVLPVTSSNLGTFELSRLKPGDLLFWTGTYDIQRDPPITHVMIYLGTNKQTGKPVMMGASEGRTYVGKSRYGVSVFDFVLPRPAKGGESSSRFIGYGPIPGL